MIIIYESFASGQMHVPVNAGLIETAALAFPGTAITFYAESNHLEHVRAYLTEGFAARITFRAIKIANPEAGSLSYVRQSFTIFRKIQHESPPGSLLLLTFATALTLMALKFYQRLSPHFCLAQVVLHGDLAEIDGWRSRNPMFRYWNLRGALTCLNLARLRYILLERSIADALTSRLPGLKPYIDVLPHPAPHDDQTAGALKTGLKTPVTIGYLGLVTKLKGFPLFRDIAERMKGRLAEKISFLAIGHTKGRPLPEHIDCLDVKPKTDFLSRDEYTRLINRCHYICLAFSKDLYALSPSGTLLDAIAAQKPLIALATPTLEEIFRNHGDIGYLCSSVDEICQTIENIVQQKDDKRYRAQQQNMKKLYLSRRPEALAGDYRTLIAKSRLTPLA